MARWWRFPLLVFVAVWVALATVSWFAATQLDRHPDYPQPPGDFPGSSVLEGWKRWDGNWYELIATEGYWLTPGQQSPVAFFPAYPLAMRAIGTLTGDVILAGIVITLAAGLTAALLFWRWAADRTTGRTAKVAVVTLLVYPYAWYLFGAVYADALFLAAALAAFLLLERDHPVLAGLAGAVATATRPTGVAVVVGLAALVLERRGILHFGALERFRRRGWTKWRPRWCNRVLGEPYEQPTPPAAGARERSRLRPSDAGVALSAAGLAAWMFYLWSSFGSATAFAEVEAAPGWDQAAGPRTWFKITYLQHIHHLPEYLNDAFFAGPSASDPKPWTNAVYTLGIMFQSVLVLAALLAVPVVLRRLGMAYAVYTSIVVAIPLLGSKDFQGTGRYLLAAFPAFLVAGRALEDRPRARVAVWAVSGLLLAVWTSAYARGYYVA